MSTRKSYWLPMLVSSDRQKSACKSWFSPIADDLTPYRADVLCDLATDREKKVRAFMTDADGKHFHLERTRGGRTFSVSIKQVDAPKDVVGAVAASAPRVARL